MQTLAENKIKSSHEHLVIFTRYPEPGVTKTRMIPLLGPKGAAKLQQKMTEHLMGQIKGLSISHGLIIEILYEGGGISLFKNWLGDEYNFIAQHKGELGERMKQAFKKTFNQGAYSTVIIGTDIPGITAGIIIKAFKLLKKKNLLKKH